MMPSEGPGDPRAKARGIAWPHTRGEVAQMTGFDAKKAGARPDLQDAALPPALCR